MRTCQQIISNELMNGVFLNAQDLKNIVEKRFSSFGSRRSTR